MILSMTAGRLGLVGQRDAAELEIVPHAQLRKDVAALRHIGDAGIEDFARREIRDGAAVEG